jgi:hypothetical protein
MLTQVIEPLNYHGAEYGYRQSWPIARYLWDGYCEMHPGRAELVVNGAEAHRLAWLMARHVREHHRDFALANTPKIKKRD